jgi:ribosomal protein S27AE
MGNIISEDRIQQYIRDLNNIYRYMPTIKGGLLSMGDLHWGAIKDTKITLVEDMREWCVRFEVEMPEVNEKMRLDVIQDKFSQLKKNFWNNMAKNKEVNIKGGDSMLIIKESSRKNPITELRCSCPGGGRIFMAMHKDFVEGSCHQCGKVYTIKTGSTTIWNCCCNPVNGENSLPHVTENVINEGDHIIVGNTYTLNGDITSYIYLEHGVVTQQVKSGTKCVVIDRLNRFVTILVDGISVRTETHMLD